MNGFSILSKASVFVALSAMDGMIVVTTPVERSVVIISQDARAAIPSGMISHIFCAAGSEDENRRSIAPAEKLNPARKPRATVIIVKIPYSNA